jgi:hypothetical protein
MRQLWHPSENTGRGRKKRGNKRHVTAHLCVEWVAIKEEGKEGIRELSDLLSLESVEPVLLLVTKGAAHTAHECIEKFRTQQYPELKT